LKPLFPLIFVVPLAIPLALGAMFVHFGGGPTVDDVVKDFTHEDSGRRRDALRWMSPLRRTTMWESLREPLHDEHERVRKHAIRVLEKMKNPLSLPLLEEVYEKYPEHRLDVLDAMSNFGFPQVFPYLERRLNDPDPEIRKKAAERIEHLKRVLHQEVCFYSLGEPIYNQLGHIIYSQGILFPEGRAMISEAEKRSAEWLERVEGLRAEKQALDATQGVVKPKQEVAP
jgi:hypothetical protein